METKSMKWNEYVAPEVEALEVAVEQGFAGSITAGDENAPQPGDDLFN